jgi:hypothetical protein
MPDLTVTLPAHVWQDVLSTLIMDCESAAYEDQPELLDNLGDAVVAIGTALDNTPAEEA